MNPPLVRMVAALPVVLCGAKTDWTSYDVADTARSDFDVGRDFLAANGPSGLRYFTLARWACIPFSVLGALVCWIWARQLYGETSGLISLVLWCFCPNILAHAQLITPDVGAASLGVAGNYAFWRWLRSPDYRRALLTGGLLGLVELAKTTWLVLFLLWPLLWVFWRVLDRKSHPRSSSYRQLAQLALICFVAIWVINLAFLDEGSFESLKSYRFVSESFGLQPNEISHPRASNRFADSWLGLLPMPFPKNYVLGIDHQKRSFERGVPGYLRGKWTTHGWYYYYLYGMLIKVPLGTWILWLLALAAGMLPSRCLVPSPVAGRRLQSDDNLSHAPATDVSSASVTAEKPVGAGGRWRHEIILLAPAIAILVFVSLQTGINRHLRYVLPAFPFLFIWASKTACYANFHWRTGWFRLKHLLIGLVLVTLTWSIASSLFVYPHSLSYFNELVGGPRGGQWHLADSNVDWAQDYYYLERWYCQHPEARPLHCALGPSMVNPSLVGIEAETIPRGPVMNRLGAPATRNWPWNDIAADSPRAANDSSSPGPVPGWFAVSVNGIHEPDGRYEYFLNFEPTTSIGYSTMIYFITLDEANQFRRELGMEQLAPERNSGS